MRRSLVALLAGAVIGVTQVQCNARDLERVVRMIDGDTFVLERDQTVRLLCIDTPEEGTPYSRQATNYLTSLVLDQLVSLEKDVSETDRYGRLLRYVSLEDGTSVNYSLVFHGLARVAPFPPDTKHCAEYAQAEEQAKASNVGMWER